MKLKVTDIVFGLLAGLLPFSILKSEEIHILESNNSDIIFEYSPDTLVFEETPEGTYIRAKNCNYTEDIGKPLLPIRTFHIGIPEFSDYSVSLLSIETGTKSRVNIVPVPELFSFNGVSEYRFTKDEKIYSSDEYYPPEQLFYEPPSFLRDQRILAVKIPLARYNPRQNSLIFVKKVKVKVSYSPAGIKKSWRRDTFEEVYKALLLNYEISKFWRRARKKMKQKDDPFMQSNFWYKLSIKEEGVYRIGYMDLRNLGVNPNSIDPRTIKLYNGGSKPLPENLTEPRPQLREIPVWIEGEADGSFDPSDYLIFYGIATSRWEYPTDDYSYFENPYTDTNVFWLTWGGEEGLRMEMQDGFPQDPAALRPTSFETPMRIEENRINSSKIAKRWEWEAIEASGKRNYTFETYGVEPGSEASFSAKLRTSKPTHTGEVTHRFRIYLNNKLLADTSVNYERPIDVETPVDTLLEGENEIRVENLGEPNSILYLDFFEIRYTKKYIAKNNQLSFTLPHSFMQGTYEFEISEFTSSKPFLLDVTDPFSPRMIVNFNLEENRIRFQADIDNRRFYHLTCWEQLKEPSRIELADLQHLRSSPGGDYIALVYDDFFYTVQPLISWRKHQFQNPVIVKISSVYDEFSWGLKDPTAIRDFLKYWYENGVYQPAYCFLVGDGSYDYKNYLRLENPDNFIPPTDNCVDNWYGDLDPEDSYRDVCIGRINPHSAQEAQLMLKKIVDYEKTPNYGFWRNRILLLADNLLEGGGNFPGDIEELANECIPNQFDIRKIHLLYKTYDDPLEWPRATEDAIEEWSEGFLAGCYMGHGGPHTVAHEQLLLYKDIFSFENGMRLPFFYFASCDIGRFDVPNDPCLGEDLLKMESGGALAVIAASRPTSHYQNAPIGFKLFKEIFFTTPTPTLGEAFLVAKPGKSVHTLFGDPATKINSAALSVSVSASPDSLVRKSQVKVVTSAPQGFKGYVNIYAFDSAELYYVEGLTLHIPGVPIFKGTIHCERMDTLSFTIPGQLQDGELGRISCYAWSDTLELVGLLDSLKVGGSAPPLPDTSGPSITLFEGNRILKDGDYVPQIFRLVGVLEDPSGIYMVSRGSPRFFLRVNGYLEADLSRYFTYDVGSSTKGRFDYTLRLSRVEPDTNEIQVVVRDNLLNTTTKKIRILVSSPSELAIKYAFNYPNPISDWTYFNFYLTQKAECEIKIFAISGRLIRWIRNIHGEVGQNQVYWDGKDSDGDSLANGVYIYRIIAKGRTDSSEWGGVKTKASLTEKLVVMR